MSTFEIAPPQPSRTGSSSNPSQSTSDSSRAPQPVAVIDIGSFVANYKKMVEVLYPLELVSSSILYVVRLVNDL
jgi:hypothetical protein